jgi:microcystin-dependent protein
MTDSRASLPRRRFLGRALAALATGAWLGRGERAAEAQTDQPYVGEIKMFAGTFAPAGWMFCEGQLLSISENETLFNLIGTTYGGDGQSTFALPDLRGRAPVHQGQGSGLSNWVIGQAQGVENVTLIVNQIPAHSHAAGASTANGDSDSPAGRVPARSAAGAPQYGTTMDASLAPGAVIAAGGSSPHNNMQPYLCINFIISLYGVYPSPV